MKISPQQYAEALYQLVVTVPAAKLTEAVRQFVLLLQKKNQLYLADKIIQAFGETYRRRQGIAKVVVTTAKSLSQTQATKIKSQLEQLLRRQIEAVWLTEGQLIGGLKLQVDDNLIDGSLKRKLLALKSLT